MPRFGNEIAHGGAAVFRANRRKHTPRLIYGNVNQLFRRFERAAIHQNAVALWVGFLPYLGCFAIYHYPTCQDELFTIAPGANPSLSHEFL